MNIHEYALGDEVEVRIGNRWHRGVVYSVTDTLVDGKPRRSICAGIAGKWYNGFYELQNLDNIRLYEGP